MTDFETITDPLDWEVGTHGIEIEINGAKGTYLPDISKREGWTQEEAMESLLRRCQYEGGLEGAQFTSIRKYK